MTTAISPSWSDCGVSGCGVSGGRVSGGRVSGVAWPAKDRAKRGNSDMQAGASAPSPYLAPY